MLPSLRLPPYRPALRERFTADGYLPLPGLIPPDALAVLSDEVRRLARLAVRRDFAMECMDGSPRHMTTLGGKVITEESTLIPQLYENEELLALLGAIADLDAVPVRDPLERHVINMLHEPGDTHGAHTDDYPLALVLFVQAPADPADGGLLEFASHAHHLSALRRTEALRRAHHTPGDGYLLRSDTTPHRVTPLRRAGLRRTVLNCAYTTPDRQRAVTPSAARLY